MTELELSVKKNKKKVKKNKKREKEKSHEPAFLFQIKAYDLLRLEAQGDEAHASVE